MARLAPQTSWRWWAALLVGYANSNRSVSLQFAATVARYCCASADRLGGPLLAAEGRLPDPVPLNPAACAAGPWRCRQGPGDPGAPPPAGRAAPPSPTTQPRTC